MKDGNQKTLHLDKPVPNTHESSKSEKVCLATIKLPSHSPVSDFLCREEHKDLFETLWREESNK